jgi:hypothetical protein
LSYYQCTFRLGRRRRRRRRRDRSLDGKNMIVLSCLLVHLHLYAVGRFPFGTQARQVNDSWVVLLMKTQQLGHILTSLDPSHNPLLLVRLPTGERDIRKQRRVRRRRLRTTRHSMTIDPSPIRLDDTT